jgi:NADH:ubiquinone oxidoreductase subunit 4 (subunit M)
LWRKLPYALLITVLLTVGFCPRLLTDIIQKSVAATVVGRLPSGGESSAASGDAAYNTGAKP